MKALTAEGFNQNVASLAQECEAHSDDEQGEAEDILIGANNQPGVPESVFYVKTKEGRSEKVKDFFRRLDEKERRMSMAQRTPQAKYPYSFQLSLH